MDGTFRPCARPKFGQRYVYSGYYKMHGLKFQSVVGPNGLIIELYGPLPGARGDAHMLYKSKFHERMQTLSQIVADGNDYYVYGDAAYPLTRYTMRGYKGAMRPDERAFTVAMNTLRVSVEQAFGLVVRDWAFVDFESNLKIWKQPIAKMYVVAAILTNVKTCAMAEEHDEHGNAISARFGLNPPTIHDYLHS